MYSTEFLKKVAKAHRDHGITFKYANRGGKQYVTIASNKVAFGNYWNSHKTVYDHIKAIFNNPNVYVTSGSWGGNSFDATYRINN